MVSRVQRMEIHIQKGDQKHGPFSEAQIRSGVEAGEFAPDDLAWSTGKASWQPLSALISLDVNQPPPICHPSTENQPVAHTGNGTEIPVAAGSRPLTPDAPFVQTSTETVLYEDPPYLFRPTFDFGKRGKAPLHTIVTDRRLKLDNNSYALDTVTSVKLEFQLERDDDSAWKQCKLFRRLAWAGVLFCIIALYSGDYLISIGGLAYVIGFAYLAAREKSKDEIKKRTVSTLMLSGSGKDVSIIIDVSTRYPSDDMIPKMVRAGWHADQAKDWRKQFNESRERVIAIAEAIGLAIGQKPISIPR